MHLARHWGQRWTVAFHKTSSNPFRCGYGSKSWYSMGFHDSFHIKICRLLRNYGCWFIHVPVHTRFLCVFLIRMRHYHRSVSGCFRLAASTSWKSQFPFLAILSLSFFPHFGSKPYAHKFRRASWHLPKLHGNPTQTLCFPSDFLGLAWVFDGSSMGFWWHLWLAGHCPCGSTPHRLRGGTRQPEKEMVFLEGVPHPFFQFECAIYGHSMGVWWFDGGEPKSGNVGGGLVGVWWGFGSGI